MKKAKSTKRLTGGVLLANWRRKKKMSQRDLADELGIRQGTLCDWEVTKHLPRIDAALRIEKLTGGRVPVRSWGNQRFETI